MGSVAMVALLMHTVVLALLACVGESDIVREGYAFDHMPGDASDPRGMPNLPFATATQRAGDGASSYSPYMDTSPQFPTYNGSEENLSKERQQHAKRIAEAAARQGIAGYQSSRVEQELALAKAFENGWIDPDVRPNATFPVLANQTWNPSSFPVQTGERYTIEVLSEQHWVDGDIRSTADGYSSHYDVISNCFVAVGRCRSYLSNRRRLPNANWMALSCGIGEYTREVTPALDEYVRYIPLQEELVAATAFPVGRRLEFAAASSGELICFANDAYALYWNNRGQVDVTITRLSWPPDNSTSFYQDLLK
jgi:hypothetical protein